MKQEQHGLHIWTDEDTADGCLRQAAYHGGYAKALISVMEQHRINGIRESFDPVTTADWVYKFARSAARWASAYRQKVSDAEVGYQQMTRRGHTS